MTEKDIRSKEMKPYKVENCKYIKTCGSSRLQGCIGCNVWNYLYDPEALIDWCNKQNEDVSRVTMEMHKMLTTEKAEDCEQKI